MIKLVTIISISFFTFCSLTAAITEKLTEVRTSYSEEDMISIYIIMEDQYSFNSLYSSVKDLSIDIRREKTINTLKNHANDIQREIRFVLKDLSDQGLVTDVKYLWIINAIKLEIQNNAIDLISDRQDIKYIHYDEMKYMLNNVMPIEDDTIYHNDNPENREIAYNVLAVNANEVWDLGYTGEDVIVAVIDTGVMFNHTDIINNMWTHPNYPNHGYDFFNNNNNPYDYHGHGTHCAGTVAGDGTSGSQTGVAPNALIMALQILSSSGHGQDSTLWEAVQFAIDYEARVLSISLGWYVTQGPDRYTMRTVMQNALAAGIIASVASGNAGNQQYTYPIPINVATPADCPPPWLHPDQTLEGGISAVIANAATNDENHLAGFSSRGPVTWQNVPEFGDYEHNPGMGLLKPDISAPGVEVKSLSHNSVTGYTFMSGTSMAAPATAGVAALLISKNPAITPEEICQILEETTFPLAAQKNNNTGSGLVDALAAINEVPDTPPMNAINPYPPQNQFFVTPQTPFIWENGGWATFYEVNIGTDNPPTNVVNSFETNLLFYQLEQPLQPNTLYYWQINSGNNFGITEGAVWSFQTGDRISEDFETGDFSNLNWNLYSDGGENTNWVTVESEDPFGGSFHAKSGPAGAAETSSLELTVNVLEEGVLSFYKKTETPPNKFLRFYIDDELSSQWTGQNEWSVSLFHLEEGERTLRWDFYSHNNDGIGSVWIDEISLPFNAYDCLTDVDFYFDNHTIDFNDLLTLPLSSNFYSEHLIHSIDIEITYDKLKLFFKEIVLDNSFLAEEEINYYHNYEEGVINIYWESDSPLIATDTHDMLFLEFLGKSNGTSFISFEGFELNETIVLNLFDGAITVENTPTLKPPTNLDFSVEPNLVILSWDDPLTENVKPFSYKIYRNTELIGESPQEENYYYDYQIEQLTEYEYFVTAIYTVMNIESEPSESIQVKTLSNNDDITPKYDNFLKKIYPNPFLSSKNRRASQQISFDFSLSKPGIAEFDIYNIKGQRIFRIKDSYSREGVHTISWDGRNFAENPVSSGIYFMRFTFEDYQQFKKFIILE